MKIEIVPPENKPILAAGQVWKHRDGTLYLVVDVHDGYDMVELNNATRYTGEAGQGMYGNDYVFTYVGMLKVTP